MANIKNELNNIKSAIYGKDVRSSIYDGIDAINDEVESTTGRQVDLEKTFDQLIINAGNSNSEIVDARIKNDGTSYSKLGDRLDAVDSQLEQIVYVMPKSNGIDDTDMFQNALNKYKKIQINGGYIVSNLVINNDLELCGKNKRVDIIKQKAGSKGNLITVNDFFCMSNITLKGNGEDECSGLVYTTKTGQSYSGSGDLNNCEINNFKDYGLKLEQNRNMLHAYEIGITKCGTGLYIQSSDNLLTKVNIGDCDYNVHIKKGGGNILDTCALYRSKECCLKLDHEAYYSTISNTSLDSNQKQTINITQVDTNVAERGHKFIGCSFFGNSLAESGKYNCFDLNGARGVVIQGCNFFVYGEEKVKYIVNIANGGNAIMNGNSYNIDDKRPYVSGITNNRDSVSVIDFNNNIFNSNISIRSGKKISFNSSDTYTQILQSFVDGDSYARLQIYSDGRLIFGNGKDGASIRFEVFDKDSLKLNGNLLTSKKIGVGNTEVATSLGKVVKKFEILNDNGVSMGYIPIYDNIQ